MTGRVWATLGFLLGVLVSIAGNVAHTWHPTGEQLAAAGLTLQQAEEWRPAAGAQLFAAFFPLALLVTVEVLARVSWPHGWAWTLARFGGAGLVALVAAVVSYLHLSGLLTAYGEDSLTALIGPLAVDGLMVVCGFALLAIGRLKAVEGDGVSTAEVIGEKGRHSMTALGGEEPVNLTGANPEAIAGDTLSLATTSKGAAEETFGLNASPRRAAEETGLLPVATGDPLLATARETFAEALATGSLPSVRQLRLKLKVGHPRAVRLREALAGS